MRRLPAPTLLTFCLALSLLPGCRESGAAPVDPRDRKAEELLTQYIRIDTSDPSEYGRAASLLVETLRASSIEPEILTPAGPQYPIVYARLRAATPSDRPLVLLHHMDVVEADPAAWSVPPFSGLRNGGYIWGRGAIDAKSLGVAHLEAFIDLRRSGAQLRRDVIFLAVPDEERGGESGMGALLAREPERLADAAAVLNEGGSTDTTVDRVSIWSIEVAQKVPLWLRVTARSRGGHGASAGSSATETLLDVVSDLRRGIPLSEGLTPDVVTMVRSRSRAFGGSKRRLMSDPEAAWRSGTLQAVLGGAATAATRDSMLVTTLSAGSAVNVVPSSAYAEIDMRLLPTSSPERILASARELAGDRATIDVLLQTTATPASPIEDPMYELLEQELTSSEPGSIVVPMVSAGTTDSRFFRARGIPAYGFSPFKINFYDAAGVHAADERIRIRFFHEGVSLMRRVVRAYCVVE